MRLAMARERGSTVGGRGARVRRSAGDNACVEVDDRGGGRRMAGVARTASSSGDLDMLIVQVARARTAHHDIHVVALVAQLEIVACIPRAGARRTARSAGYRFHGRLALQKVRIAGGMWPRRT